MVIGAIMLGILWVDSQSKSQQSSTATVFVVDLSHSMNVKDITTNQGKFISRLQAAKKYMQGYITMEGKE